MGNFDLFPSDRVSPRVTASESLQQLSTPCHRERESAAAFDPFPSDRVSPRARVCSSFQPLPFRPRVTASESLQQLSTPSLPTACHRERESADRAGLSSRPTTGPRKSSQSTGTQVSFAPLTLRPRVTARVCRPCRHLSPLSFHPESGRCPW